MLVTSDRRMKPCTFSLPTARAGRILRSRGCTTRVSRRTPAVSPWSPRSAESRATTSCPSRSRRCAISNTAVPSVPTRERATARASWSRCPMRSSAKNSLSTFLPPASMRPASHSFPPFVSNGRSRSGRSSGSPRQRTSTCSDGARCRWIRPTSDASHGRPSPPSSSCSSRAPKPGTSIRSAASISTAARTACASAPSTRRAPTSSPCPPAPSGTRAWSPPCSSSRSTSICATSASRPSWPSCTRAIRPTRSRRGRSRSRCA